MHPILADRRRLRLYLAAWTLVGAMLGVLVRAILGVPWPEAMTFGVPLGLVAAPLSMPAWYLCRALPLARTPPTRLAVVASVAALTMAGLWAAAGWWWWRGLGILGLSTGGVPAPALLTLVGGLGTLAYLVSLSVHYLLGAFEDSVEAGRRVLESRVAQRDAELTALRAQVDPHFLFNCLHSIAGLVGPDPAKARQMCQSLADFLRDCLALGSSARITLGREIALAEQYLRVEQVRFGQRLTIETSVSIDTADVPVPPLILQPLVENAVRHGIATCLDGGRIEITSRRVGERAVVTVGNPRDVDGMRAGTGFGLGIVRRRLSASFGDLAALVLEPADSSYRATVTIPVEGGGMTEPDVTLRVVTVDDEEPARLALRQDLEAIGGVEIVAECANGFEAVKAVSETTPDLLLLDVQMPKLDGFDVLELVGREVPVVFVTVYDEFALRAFEVHAVDYLLKPFGRARLADALDRVRTRRETPVNAAAIRASARPPGQPLERVVIRDGVQVHVVAVEKIDYIEAQDDYVAVRVGARTLLKEQTLGELEGQLDQRRFVRIHRSYLLNIERLARVELYAKDSRIAVLGDGTKLPVSRTGYQRLQQLL